MESLVTRFKYQGRADLARPLALALAGAPAMCELLAGVDLLIAAPLHPRRRRQRGYDQAELLARRLRAEVGSGGAWGRLNRVRDTPTQTLLDRRSRHLNVLGAFEWAGPRLAGRTVALVDDVATTGATLDACAAALKAAGAARVVGLTVARAGIR